MFQALGSVVSAELGNCRHHGGVRPLNDNASLTRSSATSHSSLSPKVPERRMGSSEEDEWNEKVWATAIAAYTAGIQKKRRLEALEAHDQESVLVKRIRR